MAVSAKQLVELSMVPGLAKLIASGIPSANATIQAMSNITGAFGVTGTAIVDVTATPTQTAVNNNFRVLQDRLNALTTALRA